MAKTLSWYKKELDKVFSKWVRLQGAWDQNGELVNRCYTCDVIQPISKMQNSHFVARQFLATRYDERNCRASCYACNMFYGGQPSTFARKLIEEYGPEIITELDTLKRQITKLTPDWYEEKIAYYKEKIKD